MQQLARAHGVEALLLNQLQQAEASPKHRETRDPHHWADRTRTQQIQTGLQQLLQIQAMRELDLNFAQNTLQGIIYKGFSLANWLYPAASLRPMVDIDMLIHFKDREKAFNALTKNDWKLIPNNYSAVVLPECSFEKKFSGACLSLDLHWQLSSRPIIAKLIRFPDLWQNCQPLLEYSAIKQPDAVDALVIAACHRLGHHRHNAKLLWLYEISLIFRFLETRNQLSRLAARARSLEVSAILNDALKHAELSFPTLFSHSAPKIAPQFELSAQLLHPRSVFMTDWITSDGAQKRALITERLFAEPNYLRSRFASNAPVWWLQIKRWLKIKWL